VIWPEAERGLVAEVEVSAHHDLDELLPRLMAWAAERGGVVNVIEG
jgi:hypothetical protein